MKSFLKLFLLTLCAFSLCMSVNAETGAYAYKSTSYCYNKDGSYAATGTAKVYSASNITDSCGKYYKGTILKTINGQNAYCVQAYSPMSIGGTCTAASYNQYSWMNGRWTEANAIKVGYMMQYINSQNYSAAEKYVYIVNAGNQMLQFSNALPIRTLNSRIQSAIDYANTKSAQYKKVTTTTPITASFASTTLTNVNNSYSKGEVKLSLVNGSYDAKLTVSATCNNCKVYTDSNLTNEFTNVVLNASQKSAMTLYVKTNGFTENQSVSVTFKGDYSNISYPIGKVWNCGSGKQAVMTLSTVSYQIPSASVTATAKVPTLNKCVAVDGRYFGKDGKEVNYETYKNDCLNICKVVDGKYYGKDGKEVNYDTYKNDCLNICKVVDGKYYGKDGKEVNYETYKKDCLKICKVVDGKYYGKDGKEVNYETYKNDCLNICKVVNGKYYGKDGKEVNYETYKKDCLNICKVVNGKYYGKDGKEVNYDTYKNDCLNICKVVNGKYYGKDGKEVEYTKYRDDCLKICKVENGKYYGINGNEVTEEVYRSECIPSETIIVPPTGSNASAIPVALGSLFVVLGFGTIKLSKKKNSL